LLQENGVKMNNVGMMHSTITSHLLKKAEKGKWQPAATAREIHSKCCTSGSCSCQTHSDWLRPILE